MHLRITGDISFASGVGEVIEGLSGPMREHFATRDYGGGLRGIVVCLMCRGQDLKFKRRIRLSKKERFLYMDVMLDLDEMRSLTKQSRFEIVVRRLKTEIPAIFNKYKIPDFDDRRLQSDLCGWLDHCDAV